MVKPSALLRSYSSMPSQPCSASHPLIQTPCVRRYHSRLTAHACSTACPRPPLIPAYFPAKQLLLPSRLTIMISLCVAGGLCCCFQKPPQHPPPCLVCARYTCMSCRANAPNAPYCYLTRHLQSLPKFLKIIEEWGAGRDAQAHPQVAAVMSQLLPLMTQP